jgi:cytochrome c biogenesis protein CcmG/thiol:disulfide interchange protein DsbE
VVSVGSQAPTFTLPSLTGGAAVDLDALGKDRHRPVILNFFASWCGPCELETPLVARTAAAEQAKGSAIQFIGVDSLDEHSAALAFAKKAGITYPVGSDNGQVSSGLYALEGFPQTFFISPDGTVLGVVRGKLNQAELQSWVQRLNRTTR